MKTVLTALALLLATVPPMPAPISSSVERRRSALGSIARKAKHSSR